ncbi:MAG: DUF1822 family protein [Halothece sp.]
MSTTPLPTTEPSQVELAVAPGIQETAQQACQSLSQAKERWQCYLNQICLETVIDWLQEEGATAKPQPQQSLLTVCTLVNGTAITLDDARIVLIPSEAIDTSQLRVPQEWIDIPSWAADYYFAVQVNPDDNEICIWGYATHAQLKQQGNYDSNNRCYVLAAEEMVNDLSAFWVARELCPNETTRATVPSLATLPLEQAENLLQRLSNPQILDPRLAIPFERWGALLEHDGWRQRLYEHRQGFPEQRSILDWLQSGVSQLAQQLGWQQLDWQSQLAGARGTESQPAATGFCRPLTIGEKSYELQVTPIGNPEQRVWRFQLQPTAMGEMIPTGLTLRLLSEDLQPFENNEAAATAPTEQLYIEVALVAGEGIVWETEPQPEGYEREILRF